MAWRKALPYPSQPWYLFSFGAIHDLQFVDQEIVSILPLQEEWLGPRSYHSIGDMHMLVSNSNSSSPSLSLHCLFFTLAFLRCGQL
jgi:hypothetical protein